jgi:PLP dependent protein
VTTPMGIRENFQSVSERILAACLDAGRDPDELRLIWVSKNHPQSELLEALALKAYYFGENRVQEVLEKFPLPIPEGFEANTLGRPAYELHFIGRMQKNKIRKILPLVTTIHSIDSLDLLIAVDRIAGEMGLRRDVFLQINTSRELAKGGFEPEAFPAIMSDLPKVPNLRLVGLMTMGPAESATGGLADLEETGRCFRELAQMLKTYRSSSGPFQDLAWLSMGMSGDFEIAIAEGAHFIRIGTSLFGARSDYF